MRNFIYKTVVVIIALVVIFEFTIGKTINKFSRKAEMIFTEAGRKSIVISVKNEMQKAIKKENYLTNDERVLINSFITKIKSELNSAK